MSRPMTGRAEGEPLNQAGGELPLPNFGESWAPSCVEVRRWLSARNANGRPPSDPSAGEGPPLRVLEEAIAEGRSEVTRDNAEIAALRDRVRVLHLSLRGASEWIVDAVKYVGDPTLTGDGVIADIDRALTTQEPPAKEPAP